MGRKSKLTDSQWAQISQRLLDGESVRSLARELGVAESGLRKRFSAQHEQIKAVANQLVAADIAFKELPISAQISAQTLAQKRRSISGHLLGAANFSAATAHRLSGIAHGKVELIDDAAPLNEESMETLKGIALLTRMANDSSVIPLGLIKASKDMQDDADNAGGRKLQDMTDDELLAIATGSSG